MMGESFKNAVLDAFPPKRVFYVIRHKYGTYARPVNCLFQWQTGIPAATQYTTPSLALQVIQDNARLYSGIPVSIVRVEEIITPGTKRRIEVPLGDKRQTGVAIKSILCSGYYDVTTGGFEESADRAVVYTTLSDALTAYRHGSSRGLARPTLVGIAEESTPGTTTYNETVLS